jgi:hypothetical protein
VLENFSSNSGKMGELLAVLPNTRLKLSAPGLNASGAGLKYRVVEFVCERSSMAPQLKRNPLGCATRETAQEFSKTTARTAPLPNTHLSGRFSPIHAMLSLKVSSGPGAAPSVGSEHWSSRPSLFNSYFGH